MTVSAVASFATSVHSQGVAWSIPKTVYYRGLISLYSPCISLNIIIFNKTFTNFKLKYKLL